MELAIHAPIRCTHQRICAKNLRSPLIEREISTLKCTHLLFSGSSSNDYFNFPASFVVMINLPPLCMVCILPLFAAQCYLMHQYHHLNRTHWLSQIDR
jgi:hypothetical protein